MNFRVLPIKWMWKYKLGLTVKQNETSENEFQI